MTARGRLRKVRPASVLLRALIATLALVVLAAPAASADGEPDPTFDGDGRLASDPTAYDERVTDIAIDAEGRIVVAYNATDPKVLGASKAVVSRYLPDGSIDSGFGGGGTVFVEWLEGPTPTEIVNAVAIDAAGRIVVGGHALMGASSFDHAAARFLPNGEHDASFSNDGRATFQPPVRRRHRHREVGGRRLIGQSASRRLLEFPGRDPLRARPLRRHSGSPTNPSAAMEPWSPGSLGRSAPKRTRSRSTPPVGPPWQGG